MLRERSTAGARGALGLASVLALGACDPGDSREPQRVGRAGAPIVGGVESSRDAVIRFYGTGLCTAVVVAPDLVLTAKHCLAPLRPGGFQCSEGGEPIVVAADREEHPDAGRFDAPLDPAALRVLEEGDGPYTPRIARVLASPAEDICKGDLAFLVLDRTIDDARIAPVRLTASTSAGEVLTAVGWGVATGTEPSPTRMERDVTVLAVGPAPTEAGARAVPPGFFSVGEALCRGDSGAPALSGAEAVVGLTSALTSTSAAPGDGTAADCMGELVRGRCQALAAEAELARQAFAAAGRDPWEEGQPDPRAELGEAGEACEGDEDCRSLVCVDDPAGGRVCSQGCLDRDCPRGHTCEDLGDRLRCVPDAPPPEEEGCAIRPGPAAERGGGAAAALLALAALRRRVRRRSGFMRARRWDRTRG